MECQQARQDLDSRRAAELSVDATPIFIDRLRAQAKRACGRLCIKPAYRGNHDLRLAAGQVTRQTERLEQLIKRAVVRLLRDELAFGHLLNTPLDTRRP